MLALGVPIDQVIAMSTWNPAKEIQRQELGNLSVGTVADVAVLRLQKGTFGYVDYYGGRLDGTQRIETELTVKDGKVLYDLNGLTRERWDKLPKDYKTQGNPTWDGYVRVPPASAPPQATTTKVK